MKESLSNFNLFWLFQYTLTGHTDQVYEMQLRKGDMTLLTTSEDKTMKLFKLPQ